MGVSGSAEVPSAVRRVDVNDCVRVIWLGRPARAGPPSDSPDGSTSSDPCRRRNTATTGTACRQECPGHRAATPSHPGKAAGARAAAQAAADPASCSGLTRPLVSTSADRTATRSMTERAQADTLYTLYFMEEVSARLGWAWEPREVTPDRRPVMEIVGIDQRLIGWQSTRRQQIEDALPFLTAEYEEQQGHAPGEQPPTRWPARPPTRPAHPSARNCARSLSCAPPGGSRRAGRTEPTSSPGWRSAPEQRPRRYGRGCARSSTSRWRRSTSPPWCT
ncbi:TrwC relaxase [Streptomyces lavendulae subsp. lavendulae]|uniref:TrwC relaxase n=1 Tax=Streptomyces lavendulae subsp. lavendulae TaxID=58340 RepID=A0A2K8PRY3_STRLA|nr:TrwC relaxase [Streptomyces lavendulae subsp. lavendulae]ATZ29501.1 TrwC relaxase [Streptomyces lavendulae subsp. lavendulae]